MLPNILIVDDTEVNYKLLKRMLIRIPGVKSDQIIMANDGVEGLALMQRGECPVVFTDLHMPRKDGLQMITEATRNGFFITLLSGGGAFDGNQESLKATVADGLVNNFISRTGDVHGRVPQAVQVAMAVMERPELKAALGTLFDSDKEVRGRLLPLEIDPELMQVIEEMRSSAKEDLGTFLKLPEQPR